MRSWGSRGKEEIQFYEERGLVDGEDDDDEEAGGSSKRKSRDDDLSDLMPWLKEGASGESRHILFLKHVLSPCWKVRTLISLKICENKEENIFYRKHISVKKWNQQRE